MRNCEKKPGTLRRGAEKVSSRLRILLTVIGGCAKIFSWICTDRQTNQGRKRCKRSKDLKHLIYFENLLQDAQNELVTQAAAEGKLALGYNCYYIPETLLNLPGCFSTRLRAPRCSSTEVAGYYMTNRTCPYARSILERSI